MKTKDIKQTVLVDACLYYRASTIPTICDPKTLALSLNEAIREAFPGVDKIKLTLNRVSNLSGTTDALLTLEIPSPIKGSTKTLHEVLLAALRADQSCMDPFTVQVQAQRKKIKREGSLGKRVTDMLLDKLISGDGAELVDYSYIRQLCSTPHSDVVVTAEEHFPYQVKRHLEKNHTRAVAMVAEIDHATGKTLRIVFAKKLDDAVEQDLLIGGGYAIYES